MNSLEAVGAEPFLSSNPQEIKAASKIFFPGQGSFKAAMTKLNELELSETIKTKALSGTPFFGICVGMQILFSKGSEGDNETSGLGIFDARVDKFNLKNNLKIPHMGWNTVSYQETVTKDPVFKGLKDSESFYFVHSYRVSLDNDFQSQFTNSEIRSSNYGEDFLSYIWNGENLFASQFHTEKSGEAGLTLLRNFTEL